MADYDMQDDAASWHGFDDHHIHKIQACESPTATKLSEQLDEPIWHESMKHVLHFKLLMGHSHAQMVPLMWRIMIKRLS
jgi:hypothetical protein